MLPTFLNLAFFLTLLQQDFVHFMPQVVAIRDDDDLHAAKSSGYFQTSPRSSLYSIWHNHCHCLPFEIISLLCFQDKTHFDFFSYLTLSLHGSLFSPWPLGISILQNSGLDCLLLLPIYMLHMTVKSLLTLSAMYNMIHLSRLYLQSHLLPWTPDFQFYYLLHVLIWTLNKHHKVNIFQQNL